MDAGGVYVLGDSIQYCYNFTSELGLKNAGCEGYSYGSNYRRFEDEAPTLLKCGYYELSKGLEKEGRCKFFEVKDGFIGGMIEASGLGAPSVMRLNKDGVIYKLPVFEDSISKDSLTGVWTAKYFTVSPTTSQPLVDEGIYSVYCYGPSGTASGAGMKVEITR